MITLKDRNGTDQSFKNVNELLKQGWNAYLGLPQQYTKPLKNNLSIETLKTAIHNYEKKEERFKDNRRIILEEIEAEEYVSKISPKRYYELLDEDGKKNYIKVANDNQEG